MNFEFIRYKIILLQIFRVSEYDSFANPQICFAN